MAVAELALAAPPPSVSRTRGTAAAALHTARRPAGCAASAVSMASAATCVASSVLGCSSLTTGAKSAAMSDALPAAVPAWLGL